MDKLDNAQLLKLYEQWCLNDSHYSKEYMSHTRGAIRAEILKRMGGGN